MTMPQDRLFGGAAADDSQTSTAPKVKTRCAWPGCKWRPSTPVDIPRNRLGDGDGAVQFWFCALHAGRMNTEPDA